MASGSSYTIAPLSPETWAAFEALVQRHNGIFGGCWCIWFHPDTPERGQGAEANRALKRAYGSGALDERAWTSARPRFHHPRHEGACTVGPADVSDLTEDLASPRWPLPP